MEIMLKCFLKAMFQMFKLGKLIHIFLENAGQYY